MSNSIVRDSSRFAGVVNTPAPGSSPTPHDIASPLRIYGVVLGTGMICALLIVGVYEWTKPIVEQNRIAMKQVAILNVLPEASRIVAYVWEEESQGFTPIETADAQSASSRASGRGPSGLVHAGFDDDDKLVGLAIEAEGMGYQDVIRLIYGYSFAKQAVIGIQVLESRETPGLGDRVETDATFQSNFEKLNVQLTANGNALMHPIEFVKPGEKTGAWQIDGISGATISSRAIAAMLQESTAKWIPRVHPRKAQFQLARRDNEQ